MTFDLILIGFGNVARRFVDLLDEQAGEPLADVPEADQDEIDGHFGLPISDLGLGVNGR